MKNNKEITVTRNQASFSAVMDGYLEVNIQPILMNNESPYLRATIYPAIISFGPIKTFHKSLPSDKLLPPKEPKPSMNIPNDCCGLAEMAQQDAVVRHMCKQFYPQARQESLIVRRKIQVAVNKFEVEVEGILAEHGYQQR